MLRPFWLRRRLSAPATDCASASRSENGGNPAARSVFSPTRLKGAPPDFETAVTKSATVPPIKSTVTALVWFLAAAGAALSGSAATAGSNQRQKAPSVRAMREPEEEKREVGILNKRVVI